MPWASSRPGGGETKAKYRTKEHRDKVNEYRALILAGHGWCAQPVCLMPSRVIPANTPPRSWCAGHDPSGTRYIGPVHMRCNVIDGARRGRAKQGRRKPPDGSWTRLGW